MNPPVSATGFWAAAAMIACIVLCSTVGEVLTAAAMKSRYPHSPAPHHYDRRSFLWRLGGGLGGLCVLPAHGLADVC